MGINRILANLRQQHLSARSDRVDTLPEINRRIEQGAFGWTTRQTTSAERPLREQVGLIGGVSVREREAANQIRETSQAERAAPRFQRGPMVDWRNHNGNNYITRAWNQKQCNACISFSLVGAMEANLRIQTGRPNLPVALSEASLNFCRQGGRGNCHSGWGATAALEWAKNQGGTDEECTPWGAQRCNYCRNWQQRAIKIASYAEHRTTEERKAAVERGPCIAYMFIYSDFLSYGGGIYRKTPGSRALGYHSVVIIGYNDHQRCWIIKNSMGRSWGEDGCGLVGYGDVELMIDNAFPFYSIGQLIVPPFYRTHRTGSGDKLTDLTSIYS